MVRKQSHCHRLIPHRKLPHNRSHHPAVKILYRSYLQFKISVVTRLISSFDMQEHKIISAKCLQRGKTFPLIIGVNKPGSTLNMYRTQSGIVTYTIDQVDCCYYRTCPYIRIHLLKSKHRWAISLAPRPYGIGNRSALLFMTFTQWMLGKQFL